MPSVPPSFYPSLPSGVPSFSFSSFSSFLLPPSEEGRKKRTNEERKGEGRKEIRKD
jgi:hypothetical protein